MDTQTTITTETKQVRVRHALAAGARCLLDAGIDSARVDAEILLRQALGMETTEFYLNLDATLNAESERQFQKLLSRRAKREPVAYITGRKEFWSLDFFVSPDALIPRPETELLVEVALGRVNRLGGVFPLKVLDLGTGSGAVAACLAKERPEARIWAVDISAASLNVARVNVDRHGVSNGVRLLRGDLFEPVAGEKGTFDLIVSNPPYIRAGDLSTLAPEIREWEPMTALNGGVDGLDYHRRIIAEAGQYLAEGGQLVLEIGADMAKAVVALITGARCYQPASIYQDYAGKDRVIAATKTGRPQLT